MQTLMENIRNVLSSHEQISLLKAYYSIADNMKEWNNVMPPLKKIDNPSNINLYFTIIKHITRFITH